MSAGAFIISTYETDGGTFMPIRVQPETLTLTIEGTANAAPANPSSSVHGSARVGGGKRQLGVKARYVRISFGATPPTGYKPNSSLTLPILQRSVWQGISKGNTGTYLASTVTVTGVPQPEARA